MVPCKGLLWSDGHHVPTDVLIGNMHLWTTLNKLMDDIGIVIKLCYCVQVIRTISLK